jgi:SAM-dependent methyltransferase
MPTSREFSEVNIAQLNQDLRDWFNQGAGAVLRDAELELIATILPNLFGYHIVQLGGVVSNEFLATTRISHTIVVEPQISPDVTVALIGECEALPIAAASIDVLLAPHALEFSRDPHTVLREAERVLIGEGYIVIVGFNPWSFCGLFRKLALWHGKPPWSGQFLSANRIKDWLKLLGFEIEFLKKISFRPPLRSRRVTNRLGFLEPLGRACWPAFGNVYVVVAKKRVAAVTPLKASWKTRRRLVAGGVVEPSTRSHDN